MLYRIYEEEPDDDEMYLEVLVVTDMLPFDEDDRDD